MSRTRRRMRHMRNRRRGLMWRSMRRRGGMAGLWDLRHRHSNGDRGQQRDRGFEARHTGMVIAIIIAEKSGSYVLPVHSLDIMNECFGFVCEYSSVPGLSKCVR